MKPTLAPIVAIALSLPLFGGEKGKHTYILYEKGSRFQEITLDGILSRLPTAKPLVLGDESALKNCDDGGTAAVITIGKPSLDKALETCKTTPVVFSLVSAPRFGDYKSHRNVTGVSFDLSFRLFLTEFQKVMKPGSRIGFIYSSAQNEFLTTEIDYVESEFNFTGVRVKIENREQIGAKVKQLIEEEKVKAIWVLPDPLYNQAIFRKLADLCAEKGILLVTNFEVLVTEAGAAIALAPSYFDTGVQTGEMAQKIIAGINPYDVSYQRPRQSGVYLNLKLFQELRIDLPDDLRFKEKVTTLLNDAQELQKDGNTGSALVKFREVLKYDKKNATATYFVNSIQARANLNGAYARIQSGNRRGAIPLLIAASPFLPEARARLASLRAEMRGEVGGIFAQGVAQFKNKKYQECINTMNLVLMIDPGNREAEIYKEKSGKRAKAVSAIR
ncbi:MAG: hypothetical protein J0L53_01410 [Spirochaetes bacterium]|nr:hypothetical protein [Spirochaetota bacterium]